MSESGIDSALALPLVVGDEPIGLLAVYPRQPRPLSANERALLVALAAQFAVAVQNARLHERATALGRELEEALGSEREAAKRLNAQFKISRSFAQSLSLETTLDVLAESIVTLLGVDAAVIRMPDERGIELVARAVYVNDEHVDAAARALLSRPQQLPRRELLALLERSEPLLLDADRAEALGGALALLAPFLRKGSSAAIVPIATPAELLATLTIVSLHPGRPVEGEIADTALSIAGQAALAIDNARLYAQQKEFADTMQRSLLPRAAPEIPGLELGDVYESAARLEVGGDVYDYLTLGDGRLAVVLGDVTGHGVARAASPPTRAACAPSTGARPSPRASRARPRSGARPAPIRPAPSPRGSRAAATPSRCRSRRAPPPRCAPRRARAARRARARGRRRPIAPHTSASSVTAISQFASRGRASKPGSATAVNASARGLRAPQLDVEQRQRAAPRGDRRVERDEALAPPPRPPPAAPARAGC